MLGRISTRRSPRELTLNRPNETADLHEPAARCPILHSNFDGEIPASPLCSRTTTLRAQRRFCIRMKGRRPFAPVTAQWQRRRAPMYSIQFCPALARRRGPIQTTASKRDSEKGGKPHITTFMGTWLGPPSPALHQTVV